MHRIISYIEGKWNSDWKTKLPFSKGGDPALREWPPIGKRNVPVLLIGLLRSAFPSPPLLTPFLWLRKFPIFLPWNNHPSDHLMRNAWTRDSLSHDKKITISSFSFDELSDVPRPATPQLYITIKYLYNVWPENEIIVLSILCEHLLGTINEEYFDFFKKIKYKCVGENTNMSCLIVRLSIKKSFVNHFLHNRKSTFFMLLFRENFIKGLQVPLFSRIKAWSWHCFK